MKLNKGQKELLLAWIAEGMQSDEINELASVEKPPFDVSKQQISYYRRTRHGDIQKLKKAYENRALVEGLSRKAIRVQRLQQLAEKIEEDLFDNDLMWVRKPKGVAGKAVVVREYNKAEVDSYRGVLEDIAKETGGRTMNSIEKSIDLSKLTPEQLKRIADGEELLKVLAG